jgi:hypothetical protein
MVGGECAHVATPTAAAVQPVGGRLNLASSQVVPVPFSLSWAHSGPRYPRARAPGPSPRRQAGALCPARRLQSGRPRGGRSGCRRRRGSGIVSLAGVRVRTAARACPAESSNATAACKHPAAANQSSSLVFFRNRDRH